MLVQPGERVAGRFEIESLAGTDGMEAVYRARDLQTGERVALKLLRHDAQHRERFLREARLLAGLQHPGIVRYVDSGETPEGAPFLAMEWLEGETLDARLARAELTLGESVAMVRGVAEALGAAHARGVVHRDVKPANVFLVGASPERPRLLDFGIARELVGVASLTGTGAVLGSLGYMSPEQVRGERALDARSDVFSLGLLLYRCVARQPAFAADHPLALLAMVVFHDPTPLLDRRPEVPPALDALSRRMLSRRRELRPADGAEVARALGELGDHAEGESPARSAALTGRERRLVGVVLARVAERSLDRDATLLLPAAGAVPALVGGLRLDSSEFAWLADDTLVVVLTAAGAATDLASRAARTALALRAEHPGAALVVATGSAEVGASLPSGEVLDRAATLLAASPASPSPEEAIALDTLTAELLRARFDVRVTPRGALLAGEGSADPARPAGATGALPFVGRERELSQLLSLYDATVAEPVAQAVLVTAPAGGASPRVRDALAAA
nr:protein kinase [Deltaproteobacteria bacterium]